MAEKIKGIIVEIGGDTTGLDAALKDVNNTSRSLTSELSQVQRLLKFDPNNAELLAQKQQLLNQQVENTSKKLNDLKAVQGQVEAQFQAGDLGAEKYRAFQREIADTEITLRNTQTALTNMGNEQTAVQAKTKQLQSVFAITETTLEDYADVLGTRLVNAIKNGSATSAQLEQAFKKIGTAATGSEKGVKDLQGQLERLDSGAADIQQLQTEFRELGTAADKAETEVKGVGSEIGNVIAGVAAGGGLAAAVTKALDVSALDTKIDVSFDVPEESKASVLDAVNGVKAYGLDAEDALIAVRQQWSLNADATDASNQKVISGASAIASSFSEIDLTELIRESTEMAGSLGMSQEEALGMTNALLKMGFPPDELDIMSEYGSQLARAGFSAEEIQGIFAQGIETDTWNIDVLLDGVKEGRIRMAEFGAGVDEATTKVIDGTGISATKLQEWGTAISAGGEVGKTAMTDVATAVLGIEDATKRNQVGVKLFGTLWEENGDKIGETILGATTKTGDLKANNDALNDSVARLDADPQVRLNTALQNMQTALTPLLTVIAEAVAKVADWAAKNPELAATITAVVTAVGIIIGLVAALTPLIMSLAVAAGGLNIAMLPITGTILLIVAAIAAIIAIGVLLYKNWDEITAAGKKLNDNVEKFFSDIAKTIDTKIDEAREFISTGWKNMVDNTKENIEEMKTKVSETFSNIVTNTKEKWAEFTQSVSDKITETKDKIVETMQNILSNIQEKWQSIKDFITTTMNNIVTLIVETWTKFKQTISDKINDVKTIIAETMQNIFSELQERWQAIKDDITTKMTEIVTMIKETWQDFKQTISDKINDVKRIIAETMQNIFSELQERWQAIKENITTKMSDIVSMIKTKWQDFKDTIQSKMNEAYERIKSIWGEVTSFFQGISLTQIGKNIITTLITGVQNMGGDLVSKAEGLIGKVRTFFQGVSLVRIGKSIIQGLIDGVGSMAKALWAKATSLAEGIGAKIKKALKIKSPSKVTMVLGEFTGEGLIEGLDQTMSRVKAMAGKLANAAVPSTYMTEDQAAFLNKSRASASNITGAAANNKSYVVNLHSPKALDLREATRLFQRTLNKMSLMW